MRRASIQANNLGCFLLRRRGESFRKSLLKGLSHRGHDLTQLSRRSEGKTSSKYPEGKELHQDASSEGSPPSGDVYKVDTLPLKAVGLDDYLLARS